MQDTNNTKKIIFSSLFWKFGERITAQIISLVVSIVLARLLMPEDYGAVALIMIFITIANVFVSNGLGNSLIQKANADELDFSSVFYVNIFISFVIYSLLFLIAPIVSKFYNMPILMPALRVLGLRIPVAAVNSIQHAYVSRNMLFKRFFWSTLFGTLLSGVVGIFMAYKGYGIWALVAQYLTNTCVDTLVVWFTVRWRPINNFSSKRAKILISFGWKMLVSGLIDTGYTQLRNLLIGKMYSSSDLAYYNQGDKYPQLLVVNINSSISSVLFPAMSKYQTEPQKIKYMTRKSIQLSSFVMWPLMLELAAIAEPLIRLILTEKWLPCVPYLQIFCVSYGLWPIHTANLQAINALGRSDLFLKLEIIKKIIGIIVLIISISYGPYVIAFGLIVTGMVGTFVNSSPNVKLLNYSYKEQFSDMLSPLILSVCMFLIIYFIPIHINNLLILIMLKIFLGGIVYIVGARLSKQKGLYIIIGFIKNRMKEEKNDD